MTAHGYESLCSTCGQDCTGATIADAMNAARAHESAHEWEAQERRSRACR